MDLIRPVDLHSYRNTVTKIDFYQIYEFRRLVGAFIRRLGVYIILSVSPILFDTSSLVLDVSHSFEYFLSKQGFKEKAKALFFL